MTAKRSLLYLLTLGILLTLVLTPTTATLGEEEALGLEACREVGFSTEEDFLSRGPVPADGNPIISDGDLLGRGGRVCARNAELLRIFQVTQDLGLDAADIISIKDELVAFSTELDSPYGNFRAGDLLTNQGAVIPNVALLAPFGQQPDLGLDAIHFTGETQAIVAFLAYAKEKGRDYWVQNPTALRGALREFKVDLLFSIEGTLPLVGAPSILDGDLLSAATGSVVHRHSDWLKDPIPAGIPTRGADFGLDAYGGDCYGNPEWARFSTEILYRPEPPGQTFTDGDLLAFGGGVVQTNWDLVAGFEPMTRMLGLDALTYPYWREACGPAGLDYLPLILRRFPLRP